MDNKEFDNIFAKGLREEQEFDFKELDWTEVAVRIEEDPGSKRMLWWKWLFPLLLLVAVGFIIYLSSGLNASKKEISLLKEKINSSSIAQIDTTYDKITVYEYDTIIKEVIKEKPIIQEKSLSSFIYRNEISSPFQSNYSQTIRYNLNTKGGTNDNLNSSLISPIESKNSAIGEEQLEPISVDLLEPIALLEPEKLVSENEYEAPQFYKMQMTQIKKRKWYKGRLKVGITNAWGITENKSNNYYVKNASNDVRKFMFDLGLRAEYSITEKLRAMATVSYDQIRLSAPELNDLADTLLAPDLFGELDKAKVRQSAVYYQIGLKYFTKTRRKWMPFGSLSIEAQSSVNHKLTGTFTYSYQAPVENVVNLKRNGFQLNSLTSSFGFEYHISNQLTWQVESWSRFNLWKKEDQMYGSFGIRNTVLYHF